MAEKLRKTIDEKLLKESFLYTFILGLVAHGYCFLNLMISHDSINDFYASDQWERAGFGRIFYSIYISLTRGRILLPWLVGILALCWISIAVYFILKMFQIEKKSLILLVAGICVTNPTVYALAATYLHDLDADMLAMMLSAVSAFLWSQAIEQADRKKCCLWLLGAAVTLSVAMGLYQSYLSLTITLIIIFSIKSLLDRKNFKDVLVNGLYGIGMLIAAAVVYVIELKVFEILTGVSAMSNQGYNGLGNLSQILSGNILENTVNTYISFAEAFKNVILTSYPTDVSLLTHGILMLCIAAAAFGGLSRIEWKNRILFVLLAILMPFGMNTTYFLSNGVRHVLTQYAVWMLYLLALILMMWLEKEESAAAFLKKGINTLVTVCLCLTIADNMQTANSVYVKKDIEYQSTLSYMTRVVERMEEQEEYVAGETPVLFVGENESFVSKEGFERYGVITGASGNRAITYYDVYKDYFEYVLEIPLSLSYDEEIKNDERVLEMPIFPKEGSVIMIDETLVVKLSENF